jgi:DNA-binding transcriptional LysR family regulator
VQALDRLDLNLVWPLNALLEERSVTRAAARLGLSQPTLSTALGRLRQHFEDPLLIRAGADGYRLSSLAIALQQRIPSAIAGMRVLFDAGVAWDPAVREHEFVAVVSDYSLSVIGRALLAIVTAEAPQVRIRFSSISARPAPAMVDLLRSIDGATLPHGVVTDARSLDLFSDRWVCVVADDNHAVGDTVELDQMAEASWVVPFHGPGTTTTAVRQLRLLGIEPRVTIAADSFTAVPHLVAGSERFALLQERLARLLVPGSGTRIVPCPVDARLTEAFWWHPSKDDDPPNVWLRSCFARAAATLGP